MADDDDIWFPAKRYGWGWGPPVTWQGWVVLIAFMAAIPLIAVRFPPHRAPAAFAVLVLLDVMALMAICWWKGETPRWRWGGKDEP